jgi:hypothetical protein
METFVKLLMLKKEDHLYFSLYVILFEILANDCSLTPMFYFYRRIYNSQTIVYTPDGSFIPSLVKLCSVVLKKIIKM